MPTTEEKIAALEAEIAKLKAAQAPPPSLPTEEETAKWRDEMHQARERAANSFRFRPEIQQKMNEACGTSDLRDLVHASHRPNTMEGIPSSQTLTGTRRASGMGTGWRHAAPLSNPPGIRDVDRLMDAQDARDRAARIAEDNRLRGALKR